MANRVRNHGHADFLSQWFSIHLAKALPRSSRQRASLISPPQPLDRSSSDDEGES
jgi:hypothetical protein